MKYAVSDIHGCYDKYMKLLERIDPDNDTLYVLGDIIDRGADGFRIMLDVASRPYVHAIKGNHEVMAENAMKRLIARRGKTMGISTWNKTIDDMKLWFSNGGNVSLAQYMKLSPEDSKKVWDYMLDMPLYRELSVEGKDYVLVHGGLEHFTKNRKLSDYSTDEMVWARPEPGTRYYSDKTVVVGHTPTFFYGICSKTNSKILRTDSFIDIDCGCVYGGRLGCLCLDTGEEFYL